MIDSCRYCGSEIRDCTAFTASRLPVIGWYHTRSGHERCEGDDMESAAKPRPRISVTCPDHPRSFVSGCRWCPVAMPVSQVFHNQGRCIPELCGWPHERAGS